MTAMDCATCEPLLLDLVAEDLPPEATELARAHVRGCAACGEAYAKLEAGMRVARELPDLEAPPEVTARVLALAEAHVRARGVSVQPRAPASVRPLAGLRDWLDTLGRFSMEHQVGMAAVFLVVIALGFWSLPKLGHRPDVAGGPVVNPDTTGEAAPSAGLQPAEPLDLKVDRRSGRIRSADEVEAEPPPRAASAPMPADAPGDDSEYALAEQAQGAGAENLAPKEEDEGAVAGAEEKKAKSVAPATESIAALRARVVPQPTMPAKPAAPSAFPGTATGGSADRRDEDDLLMNAYKSGGAKASKGDSLQRLGYEGAAEPEAAPAATAAGPTGRSTAPARTQASTPTSAASLLRDARATRNASGCAAALSRYRAVTTSYPGTPEAGEALLERARCLTQLGRTAEARTDLQQATRIASSAARAKALLGASSAK